MAKHEELFCLMGPGGESRVFHADGRPCGPANTNRKGKKMKSANRRIAALEKKVAELEGDTPKVEDVELPFAVQELWGDDEAEPTAVDDDLGFEVRDLWADD